MTISRVSGMDEQTDREAWSHLPDEASGYGAPTILIVDDEAVVRAFTSEVLGLEGYAVLEASGSAEGVRIAAEHLGPIDLVISDVVMRDGDDGRDLVERLKRVRPSIKPLFISGHAERDVVPRGASLSAAFLQKPFTMDMLIDKVRAVLDAGAASVAHR